MQLNLERRQRYTVLNGGKSEVNKSEYRVRINFDLKALGLMCCYVASDNQMIRKSNLINMRNLFSIVDMSIYENDTAKKNAIDFINKALEARLVRGINDPYIITKYANGGISEDDLVDKDILDHLISNAEAQWIQETVATKLKFSHIDQHNDRLIELATRYKAADYMSQEAIVAEFERVIDDFKASFRRTRVESMNDVMFSLRQGHFEEVVSDAHAQLCNPSSRLLSGMHSVNMMTAGGFENGRSYMFFGVSGGFKSGVMLNLALQFKKHNKSIKTKDPTKIPCVVLLTMENTVKESIERLFNASTAAENIRDFSTEEVINRLRREGELYLNDESPIDIIIKYKPNGSVDTSYLYTLVEDLEDEGYECVCMIQDYVKRIRSTTRHQDIRLELGEIVNEFRTFAAIKDIPIISASQLNRDAARTLDQGADNNKADLTRMLGRANVGESMLMIDNLDWACIINREMDENGLEHLVFKLIKIRYAKVDLEYAAQPFVTGNGMRLLEDIYSPYPLFKTSLAKEPAFVSGPSNVPRSRFNSRPNIEDAIPTLRHGIKSDDDIFDFAKIKQQREEQKILDKIARENAEDFEEVHNQTVYVANRPRITCPIEYSA